MIIHNVKRNIDIKSRFLKNAIVILKRIMMPRLWEWKTIKGDIFNTQNWPYAEINDEFICPNHKRLGFKRYAYRHNRYEFKRDFKLYECDDCSACPFRNQCMKSNSKANKKIMRNCNWEYFKAQSNQKLSKPETQKSTIKEKLM